MNNQDCRELKVENVKEGDNLSILFGIPPTKANFTVFKCKGKLIARCHNARPKNISVNMLFKYFDNIERCE